MRLSFNPFQFLAGVLALSALIKVAIGLFFHEAFYAWVQDQYALKQRSPVVTLLLGYALLMLLLVWAATLTVYVPYGWILTSFVTLASAKTLHLLLFWEKSGSAFVRFLEKHHDRLRLLDAGVALLGLFFIFLAWKIY